MICIRINKFILHDIYCYLSATLCVRLSAFYVSQPFPYQIEMSDDESEPEIDPYDRIPGADDEGGDETLEYLGSLDPPALQMSSGWVEVDNSLRRPKLYFNKVDEVMLATVRAELPVIVEQVKQALGKKGRNYGLSQLKSLPIEDFSRIWFNNDLLRNLMDRINRSLPDSESINKYELFQFVKTELYLCIYGVSPETYFDANMAPVYPSARNGLAPSCGYLVMSASLIFQTMGIAKTEIHYCRNYLFGKYG
jgi:hypothetical protein